MTREPPRSAAGRRRPFSALIWRILALNIVALAFLVGGVLYLNQFRTGLIDTRMSALLTQAEVISAAIGEAATEGPDSTTIDADRAKQIMARLVVPTRVRARLFDASGTLLADSRELFSGREIVETNLPPPSLWTNITGGVERIYEAVVLFLTRDAPLPGYVEKPLQRAQDYDEAMVALSGNVATAVRTTDSGSLMLSAAVPVQRFRRVLGTLLAAVETSEIEELVRQDRLEILELFGVALIVSALLSLILARTIALPVHRLADAADKVGMRHARNIDIPDFSRRRDEIGDLSRSLKTMTEALYGRIDAIETFAADVAHEIKNPLTSLRAAVETLVRTKDSDHHARLLEVIQDDVRRIDRLISDISNASRIDAELSRADMKPVDIGIMLETLVEVYKATSRPSAPAIELNMPGPEALIVPGIENKLGQVFRNLLDNSVSFSPSPEHGPKSVIRLDARREDGEIVVSIEDQGPGIPPKMLLDIFNRFYTERPGGEAFGTHSGLGLSISKQIIEAHAGSLEAQNRFAETGKVAKPGSQDSSPGNVIGARFIVRIPV